MTQHEIALAAFVKTPGFSPIKTRLAGDVGEVVAAEFYRLAVDAVEATLLQVASESVKPHWAIAEESALGNRRWKSFQCVSQGAGSLGERLSRVVAALQSRHAVVAVMGVDSPQISEALLVEAFGAIVAKRSQPAPALGRCHDGGFYFLGTNVTMPRSAWSDIEYSTSATADEIAARLSPLGEIVELPVLTDVDRAGDLIVLRRELEAVTQPTDPQRRLLEWLREWS